MSNSKIIGSVLRPDVVTVSTNKTPPVSQVKENIIQLSPKKKDPVTAKYELKKTELKKELKKLQKTKNKKEQVKFIKQILNKIIGKNPFKKIEVKDLSFLDKNRAGKTYAVTDWVIKNLRRHEDVVGRDTMNKDLEMQVDVTYLNSASLEGLISTLIHEVKHARQFNSDIPYESKKHSTSGERVDNVLKSIGEMDAYYAQIFHPFYLKTTQSYKDTVLIGLASYISQTNKELTLLNEKEQIRVMNFIPKFKVIQIFHWYKKITSKEGYKSITVNPTPWVKNSVKNNNTKTFSVSEKEMKSFKGLLNLLKWIIKIIKKFLRAVLRFLN